MLCNLLRSEAGAIGSDRETRALAVARDRDILGVIRFKRDGGVVVADAVSALRDQMPQVRFVYLSSGSQDVAETRTASIGLDAVFGELDPFAKAEALPLDQLERDLDRRRRRPEVAFLFARSPLSACPRRVSSHSPTTRRISSFSVETWRPLSSRDVLRNIASPVSRTTTGWSTSPTSPLWQAELSLDSAALVRA